jgi:hypothetical protein
MPNSYLTPDSKEIGRIASLGPVKETPKPKEPFLPEDGTSLTLWEPEQWDKPL